MPTYRSFLLGQQYNTWMRSTPQSYEDSEPGITETNGRLLPLQKWGSLVYLKGVPQVASFKMSKAKNIYRVPEGKDSTESLFRPRSYSNKGFRAHAPRKLPALSTAAPTSGTNSFLSKFESTTPPMAGLKRPPRIPTLRSKRERLQRSRMRPEDNSEDMFSMAEYR